LPFCSKKCATDCSLIREPLVGPFSLGMRFSESLSMTTDLGLFWTIFDRMSIFKPLKIKVLSPILRKSVESQYINARTELNTCLASGKMMWLFVQAIIVSDSLAATDPEISDD
jgi:hypothetical protein